MPNSKAFVRDITTEGGVKNEHQSSPHWVLTFIRWAERDTLRTAPNGANDFTKTVDPLVVENDCVQLSTSMNKATLTPTMEATLLFTDVNYLTAVAPGDFCLVNMVNWGDKARDIVIRANAGKQAINRKDDGFKGVFKVQSVRQLLVIDPTSGAKHVAFRITGYAFTEFNNTIYFNPAMVSAEEVDNVALFVANMGSIWANLVSEKGLTNVQNIIIALIQMMIGTGVSALGRADKFGTIKTPNTLYFIPPQVTQLLGLENARAAKDMYAYLFGIQEYGGGGDLAKGMNPVNIRDASTRMMVTTVACLGEAIQKAEYWNQVKLWSILQQFVNAPLNELFTTFRIAPDGLVMPTVVFRQIPFTNDSFDASGFHVTRYMNLPRWRIDPAMILALDIGRDEAARINFVQLFGRSTLGAEGVQISAEVAARNFMYDSDDVKRSGLRPLVVTSSFDEGTGNKPNFLAPQWARIVGDALIGGHLKMNGTIQCLGIQDPIAVGDNLEFNGVVYHIEQISHTCSVSADGRKTFRTSLSLSSGISIESNAKGVAYAQMSYGNGYAYRNNDSENNGILPGVSESQDTVGRKTGLDDTVAKDKAFEQPNTQTSIHSAYRFNRKK